MKRPDPNRIGDRNELLACAWLLGEGYEVFRNVGSTGLADLVIRDPNTNACTPVQVKTLTWNTTNNNYSFSTNNRKLYSESGIRLLWVHPETGTVGWVREDFEEIKILRHRPDGWNSE